MIFMRGFWHIYGKTAAGIVCMIALAIGLMALIWKGWGKYAVMYGMSVQEENSGNSGIQSLDRPVLYVKNIRVPQGQKLLLSSITAARDVDGTNLDSQLCFTDSNGKTLKNSFDTSVPGCYSLTVTVCSRKTGRKARKTMMILVDGRCMEWKR
jgi:hypothetical protein